jgi:hypothetical protein
VASPTPTLKFSARVDTFAPITPKRTTAYPYAIGKGGQVQVLKGGGFKISLVAQRPEPPAAPRMPHSLEHSDSPPNVPLQENKPTKDKDEKPEALKKRINTWKKRNDKRDDAVRDAAIWHKDAETYDREEAKYHNVLASFTEDMRNFLQLSALLMGVTGLDCAFTLKPSDNGMLPGMLGDLLQPALPAKAGA